MSRYFNSFMDDYSEALEHSWGTSPEAKAREKEYNHWYYQKHKAKIAAIRKQRHAATNSYKQAEKSRNDANRYADLSRQTYNRIVEYYNNLYKEPYIDDREKATADRLHNDRDKYQRMSIESEAKSRKYKIQGDMQATSARTDAKKILQHIKNPTVKDLVEFYLDTTIIPKAKKAANKAKKYATKTVKSVANKAKKYMQ